jgi:hypothetical protein
MRAVLAWTHISFIFAIPVLGFILLCCDYVGESGRVKETPVIELYQAGLYLGDVLSTKSYKWNRSYSSTETKSL